VTVQKRASAYRSTLVNIVNMLGAPRPCPVVRCEGCEYERQEAVCEGLIVLGYLEPPKYKLSHTSKNAAGGDCRHFEFDGPQPDPMDAWERFMKAEFDVEIKAE
jgi:hypothetical protein